MPLLNALKTLNKNQQRLLLLCGSGGMLEMYDFIIYALLAPLISQQFFPTGETFSSMLATFTTFAVGYFARPVGGIIFGHIGDRVGRKKTFVATIILMALSTLLIGLLPNYLAIGIAAPILLTSLRILQGVSVGGEIPGAITYISENLPKHQGLATGTIFFFIANGITLAALLHWILSSSMPLESFNLWGWRLLFIIGGLLGLLNFTLRQQMCESPVFEAIKHRERFPLLMALKNNLPVTLTGIIITGFGACTLTLLYLFIPSFLTNILNKHHEQMVFVTVVSSLLGSICSFLFGVLSDYTSRARLLFLFIGFVTLVALPVYHLYTAGYLWLPFLLGGLCFGIGWGIIPPILASLFDARVRFSGIALCYNIGFALFSGLAPLISLFLIKASNHVHAPAYYLIVLAIITSTIIFFITRLSSFNAKKLNLLQ